MPLADQRARGAGRDRDVVAADVVEHADRVRRRLLQRLVAGHGGDAEQPDLGAGEREQDRDRVVVAGVAVEDDVGHAVRIASRRVLVTRGTLVVNAITQVDGPETQKQSAYLGARRPAWAMESARTTASTASTAASPAPAAIPFTSGDVVRASPGAYTLRPFSCSLLGPLHRLCASSACAPVPLRSPFTGLGVSLRLALPGTRGDEKCGAIPW